MKKNIINKLDSYIDTEIKLITCYTEALYKNLKFYSLVENKEFIHGLELGSKKLLLGYLRDIRFYYRFLKDIANKYPEFDIKKIQKNIFILEASNIKKCYICLNDINIISFKEIIEQNMKFDVIIANPPYDKNLHLKILEQLIPNAKKVVNISPIRWLQDPLAKYKKGSDYKRFEETISKKIENLYVIDAVKACKIFNAEMSIDLGIYVISNGGFNYERFSSINLIDNYYNKQCFPVFDEMQKNGWRVRIPYITSGGGGHNKIKSRSLGKLLYFYDGQKDNKYWYEYYNKNQYTKISQEIPRSIKFNSEQECKNFIDSLYTKTGKYFMNKILVDVHVQPETILWTNDYTQPWTDKRFCEYFKITGYIDDEHAEPGSEWETILNEMK